MPQIAVTSGYPDGVGAPVMDCPTKALVLTTIFNRDFRERVGLAVVKIRIVETDTRAQGVADEHGVVTFQVTGLDPGDATIEVRAEHPTNGLYREYQFRIGPSASTDTLRNRKLVTSLECDADVQSIRLQIPVSPSLRRLHVAPPEMQKTFNRASNSEDLTHNAPIVIIKNCGTLKLSATTDPGYSDWHVEWVRINTIDGTQEALPKGPEVTWTPTVAGLFRFRASLGGSAKCIHVVVAEIAITANAVTHYMGQRVMLLYNPVDGFKPYVLSKLYPDDPERTVFFDVSLQISAGGNAQADPFLAKIHAGFANNLLSTTLAANYAGGTRTRERILVESVQNARAGQAPEIVLAGNAQWGNEDLACPILDRGGTRGTTQAAGGATIFLAWNNEAADAHPPAHTHVLRVTGSDKPNAAFYAYCPVSSQPMQSLTGHMRFRAWLLVFSEDCNYTYVALGNLDWTCNYDIDTSAAITWAVHTKPALPRLVTMRHNHFGSNVRLGQTGVEAADQVTLIAGGQEAGQAGCEVRPPVYKDGVYDTR